MMAAQFIGEYLGVSMYFEGISYNAPSLKLYGYSTDLALKRAIARKLKKRGIINPGREARFRHEDIAAVPQGWKVRTVSTPSGHRVRVAFPKGRRKTGSGRLVSILHPNTCANPCTLRSHNPEELMVMSANNPPRSRLSDRKRLLREAMGFAKKADLASAQPLIDRMQPPVTDSEFRTLIRIATDAQLHMRRGNPAQELLIMSGNPRDPHLNVYSKSVSLGYPYLRGDGKVATDGRTWLSRSTKHSDGSGGAVYVGWDQQSNKWIIEYESGELRENPRVEVYRTENPSAQAIAEAFSGRPLEFVDVDYEPHMPKARYAFLSKLVGLTIKPEHGGQVQGVAWWEGPARAHDIEHYSGALLPLRAAPDLVADEIEQRLWLFKGGQDISSAIGAFGPREIGRNVVRLGTARVIRYRMKKSPVDDELMDYVHTFGEEGGEWPQVLFDKTHKKILLDGGSYRIDGLWIKN